MNIWERALSLVTGRNKTIDQLKKLSPEEFTRGYGQWVDSVLLWMQKNANFLDNTQQPSGFGDKVIGLYDTAISPSNIYEMVERDTYYSGLFEQLTKALLQRGFYVETIDGEKNQKTKYYEQLLTDWDIEEKVEQILYGLWGDGGGNVLLFATKDGNKNQIHIENFLTEGYPRVRVFGDSRLRKITKYEVIDSAMHPVYSINKNMYYKHLRYRQGGDYRFSSNPSKRAVYWYILKKYIGGANVSSFERGGQDNVLMFPDYGALTDIANAMSNISKVTGAELPPELSSPFAFMKMQSTMDDKILQDYMGNPRFTNALMKLKMPYKMERVGRDNQSMETSQLIKICDEQMGYALRSSKSIVSSKDAKYNNAQQETDNWYELVLDPVKTEMERLLQDFVLPVLDATWDKYSYRVRFGRDPNAEAIEIYKARSEKNAKVATIIATLPIGYKYNLETDSIEEIVSKKDEETSTITKAEKLNGEQINAAKQIVIDYHAGLITEEGAKALLQAVGLSADTVEDMITKKDARSFEEERDEVYDKYHSMVNMSRSELEAWSKDECSHLASLDRSPIRRNLELLTKSKEDWTSKHVSWANKTIGFISRMSKAEQGQEVIAPSGKSCPSKRDISLKNWAFDPSKGEANNNYKTKSQRAKQNIVEQTLESPIASKFGSIVLKALKRQNAEYVKRVKERNYSTAQELLDNVVNDYPAIRTMGLTAQTITEQLQKFAKVGVKDIRKKREEIVLPTLIDKVLSAKALLLTRGFNALSEEQLMLIEEYYGRELLTFKGLDEARTVQVMDTIRKGIADNAPLEDIIKTIGELSYNSQAKTIVDTEAAQALEMSRFVTAKEDGLNVKKWDTVEDELVRSAHRRNGAQGWITIDTPFASGAMTPASEINCRCSVTYDKAENTV